MINFKYAIYSLVFIILFSLFIIYIYDYTVINKDNMIYKKNIKDIVKNYINDNDDKININKLELEKLYILKDKIVKKYNEIFKDVNNKNDENLKDIENILKKISKILVNNNKIYKFINILENKLININKKDLSIDRYIKDINKEIIELDDVDDKLKNFMNIIKNYIPDLYDSQSNNYKNIRNIYVNFIELKKYYIKMINDIIINFKIINSVLERDIIYLKNNKNIIKEDIKKLNVKLDNLLIINDFILDKINMINNQIVLLNENKNNITSIVNNLENDINKLKDKFSVLIRVGENITKISENLKNIKKLNESIIGLNNDNNKSKTDLDILINHIETQKIFMDVFNLQNIEENIEVLEKTYNDNINIYNNRNTLYNDMKNNYEKNLNEYVKLETNITKLENNNNNVINAINNTQNLNNNLINNNYIQNTIKNNSEYDIKNKITMLKGVRISNTDNHNINICNNTGNNCINIGMKNGIFNIKPDNGANNLLFNMKNNIPLINFDIKDNKIDIGNNNSKLTIKDDTVYAKNIYVNNDILKNGKKILDW